MFIVRFCQKKKTTKTKTKKHPYVNIHSLRQYSIIIIIIKIRSGIFAKYEYIFWRILYRIFIELFFQRMQ